MASGRPAGALLYVSESSVIDRTDDEAVAPVLSEVALQTKIGVTDFQHLVIDAPMCVMTGATAIAHCFMFKHEWTSRSGMALRASTAGRSQDTFGEQGLVISTVGIMAIDTGHLAVGNRVTVGQSELALDLKVTLQAGCGVFTGIMDQVPTSTLFRVQAAGAMAGLAAKLKTGIVIDNKPGMNRVLHIPCHIVVAEAAIFAANKLRTGSPGNRKHRPVD